ncbi:MAG: tetratricopeptide repeat protein, partial [Nitrospiraceae bacterium]|nr:tetratricopeptide repeat protein [Nitrospiraceae bacterium]
MNLTHRAGIYCFARCAIVAMLGGLLILGCSERRSQQYRLQGDTYLRLYKYEEAAEAYQNAIQSNPENAPARIGLGRCMAAVGKPEDALASFQETTR